MKKITMEELVGEFDPSVSDALWEKWRREEVDGMVVFENLDMCSSHLGEKTAMIVGPECTYKSVAECEKKWLNDLPSMRKYAVRYAEKSPRTEVNHAE